MSGLRSALDELASGITDQASVEQLDADASELLCFLQRGEVILTQVLRAQTDRGDHQHLGYRSATAYLMHRGGLSVGHARRVVSDAGAVDRAPRAHAAWADGRLSTDQARRLFALADAVPDIYPDAEVKLVDIVEPLSVSDTGKALEYWRQAVDGPGELSTESQMMRRGLSVSKMHGMRHVDGWMTDQAGEAFETALEANMPPPSPDDPRTPRQRRHDALEDLARAYLDSGDAPTAGGEKPHIMVLTDVDALAGIAGGLHETLNGRIWDVATIRRLACDASISRIILGPDSEILDVGRKTRVWTTAQRRAITARDRHCQTPGCERPSQWCDIHHTDHCGNGGPTSVDKGKLYCRFHHTQEHIKEAKRRRDKPEG